MRKIHFIAQTYWETDYFRSLIEYENVKCVKYHGGCDFKGSGLIHLTHDENYLKFYDEYEQTNYFQKYKKLRGNNEKSTVKDVIDDNQNMEFNIDFYDKLIQFAKRVSTELEIGTQAAGYFWEIHDLNEIADRDNCNRLTKIINGNESTAPKRLLIVNEIKKILKFESKCISRY